MTLVAAILLGLAMGAVVELLLPGHTVAEGFLTGLLGIAASLLTCLIGQSARWFWPDEPQCFLSEIVGALLVLIAYGLLTRRHRPRQPSR